MAQLGGVTPKSTTSSNKVVSLGGVTPKSTTSSNKVVSLGGVSVTVNK